MVATGIRTVAGRLSARSQEEVHSLLDVAGIRSRVPEGWDEFEERRRRDTLVMMLAALSLVTVDKLLPIASDETTDVGRVADHFVGLSPVEASHILSTAGAYMPLPADWAERTDGHKRDIIVMLLEKERDAVLDRLSLLVDETDEGERSDPVRVPADGDETTAEEEPMASGNATPTPTPVEDENRLASTALHESPMRVNTDARPSPMTRVFISHAAADKDFVNAFVDTVVRLGCGVPREALFYSSGADTGVPAGEDLNAYVRKQVDDDALVIAILTPTFRTRPFCIAELGAAWSRAGRLLPLAVPALIESELDGVLKGMLIRRLDDGSTLDELHDVIGKALGISTDARTWGQYRDNWLRDVAGRLATLHDPDSEVVSATSCSRDQGHMELFWTDRSGRVSHRWWLGDQGWSSVHQLEDVEADYIAAVTAEGEQLLFGVQGTGRVWMRPWTLGEQTSPALGVQVLPGDVTGPLTAVSRGTDIELTAWTTEGEQCHRWRQDGAWSQWDTHWRRIK